MALKRINMNLSEDLLKKIDAYAYVMGVNRSSAISVLISTQLQQFNFPNRLENPHQNS